MTNGFKNLWIKDSRAIWFVVAIAVLPFINSALYPEIPDLGHSSRGFFWPLVDFSYDLERRFFADHSARRLLDILLYGLVAAYYWACLRLITRDPQLAFFSALLFASLPLHSEVVASGNGRGELLAALFSLLFIYHFFSLLRGADLQLAALPTSPKNTNTTRLGWLLCLVFFSLSLFCQESTMVLPILVLVLDRLFFPSSKIRDKSSYVLLIGGALSIAVYLTVRWHFRHFTLPQAHELLVPLSFSQRALLGFDTLINYLQQALIPRGFLADYSDYRANLLPLPHTEIALALLGLFALAALSVARARKGSVVLLAASSWFLITVLPLSNIAYGLPAIRADRYVFFATGGLALAAAHGLSLTAKIERSLPVLLVNILLFAQVSICISTNRRWQSDFSLWQSVVEVNPGSSLAWYKLGVEQLAQQQLTSAQDSFFRAKTLKQNQGLYYPEAALALARTLVALGEESQAILEYEEILASNPSHYAALMELIELLRRDPLRADQVLGLQQRAKRLGITPDYEQSDDNRRRPVLGKRRENAAI